MTLKTSDGMSGPFDLIAFADGYRSLGRRIVAPGAELRKKARQMELGNEIPKRATAYSPGRTSSQNSVIRRPEEMECRIDSGLR